MDVSPRISPTARRDWASSVVSIAAGWDCRRETSDGNDGDLSRTSGPATDLFPAARPPAALMLDEQVARPHLLGPD